MINKAQIVGYLGRDPEIKFTGSGTAVCNFSIATTDKWKNKQGEQQEETQWHNIVCFQRLAEVCGEYLHKGSLVFVEGKIKYEKYQTKEGVEKTATKIHIHEMKMLGGKGERSSQQPQDQQQPEPGRDPFENMPGPPDEDVPF